MPSDLPSDRISARAQLGREAEGLVAERLERAGFAIVGRNVRVGRLEIDLIARRRALVVFCEVRARTHDRFMAPVQSIDRGKVQRIRRAAALWLSAAELGSVDVRFDAASVVFDTKPPRVDYFEAAF